MKIASAQLASGSTLPFGDFNVFIGGNGVGKTTFLAELFHKSIGLDRSRYYWIETPVFQSLDVNADSKLLASSISKRKEGQLTTYFSQAAKNIDGNIDYGDNGRFDKNEYDNLLKGVGENVLTETKYRKPFVTFSSCEARLNLTDQVDITGLDQPPQDSVNVLYRDPALLKKITNTVANIFGRKFAILSHNQRTLYLGLSLEEPPVFNRNARNPQDEFERIETWKTEKFIPISEAGHGIRSMTKLLMTLLEPANQIILIDEPEMHLYPAQKRWLGKQLVSLAKTQNKQVFLVTHDPMILQGILDANTKTHIFRVDRLENGEGVIRACELDQIVDVGATRNQDQYLQGLFYQRCVVVEGASDRSFYQNMIEESFDVQDKDIGFVAAGGKNSSKHMAKIASKVGLNVAFIFDLDVFFDPELLADLYNTLGGKGKPLAPISKLFGGIETYAKKKTLSGYSNKAGMSGAWYRTNSKAFTKAINRLNKVGIFFVPNGGLESWAPSVEPKVRFAELAPAAMKKAVNAKLMAQFRTFTNKLLKKLK